jgi:hypothetical protein
VTSRTPGAAGPVRWCRSTSRPGGSSSPAARRPARISAPSTTTGRWPRGPWALAGPTPAGTGSATPASWRSASVSNSTSG